MWCSDAKAAFGDNAGIPTEFAVMQAIAAQKASQRSGSESRGMAGRVQNAYAVDKEVRGRGGDVLERVGGRGS